MLIFKKIVMQKFLLTGITILLVYHLSFAQTGDDFFAKKDYRMAIARYEQEVKLKPEKYFKMGQAFFAIKEFDKAIEAIERYKIKYSSGDMALADKWLNLLKRDDEYVEVTNLGNQINSSVSEYFPYVSKDGKRLYLCAANRTGGYGGEDLWYSEKMNDGSWGPAKNMGTELNTSTHECLMTMSGDGSVAILFGNYEGSFGSGDLFYSVKTDKGWTMPCNMGGTINSKDWESQASLSSDGKILLFCSNRAGGFGGGSDIYVSFLSENGWSTPINLGAKINTSGFEGGPSLAADGKTLYFFSNGHFGFGESDLFMARRIGDSWTEWTEPVNLGKYINTMDDDKYLTIPSSGIKAYTVRSNQPDGYGELDIYEFIMPPSMRPEIVVNVYGFVNDEKSKPVPALIRFYDAATGMEYGTAISQSLDGSYRISLPPLKLYNIVIDMKGYLYLTDVLDLTDMSKFMEKEYINNRLGADLNQIRELQQKLAELNQQFLALINENSDNIDEAFKNYDNLIRQYRSEINTLDLKIKKAKLEWLGKEDKIRDIRKDFKLQTIAVGATFELKNIFFDFGKATLKDESKSELDKLVDIMKRSEIVIELGGHTDSIGSDAANLTLSQERVNSVKQYLVNNGINPARIFAVGYGETQPVAPNYTEEGRSKNRRVEVKILQLQLGREGQDVVTDQPEEKIKEENFYFLSTLMRAAKKGGLPSTSPCSDKPVYLVDYKKTPTTTTTTKKTKTVKSKWAEVEKDNFTLIPH